MFDSMYRCRRSMCCDVARQRAAIEWERIEHVRLFDFDGTIVEKLSKEAAIAQYEEKTGEQWPFGRAFFSIPESLMPPLEIREGPAMASLRLHQPQEGREVLTCVLTGRNDNFRKTVWNLLKQFGVSKRIRFAAFTPSDWPFGSIWFKVSFVERFLVDRCRNLRLIEVWEDSPEQMELLHELGRREEGLTVTIHDVRTGELFTSLQEDTTTY